VDFNQGSVEDTDKLEHLLYKIIKEFTAEQRTSELTNANLKLTKIDSQRRQFIADVSRELKIPLTIIRGEAQVTLTAILELSVNLSRFVDDLLLLTQAEMNQLNFEVSITKIKPLLLTEVLKWQKLHRERNIFLFTDSISDTSVVSRDSPRIQQVLSISLDNANRRSPASFPLEVRANQSNRFISISIKDSGKGISATEIENIFERLVCFSKHNQGLRLGLPIAITRMSSELTTSVLSIFMEMDVT
jgi:two-component system OmpR family sensor kinase